VPFGSVSGICLVGDQLVCVTAESCTIGFVGTNAHQALVFNRASPRLQGVCDGNGIGVVHAISGDALLCGLTQSHVIRWIDIAKNQEASVFIGHVARVEHCVSWDRDLFASAGCDDSVKLWDRRTGCVPIGDLAVRKVTSMSQSCRSLTIGFAESSIGVLDLRERILSPAVGLTTNYYTPVNVCYDEENENVFIFGIGQVNRTISWPFTRPDSDPNYIFRRWRHIRLD
jgi:WD40 repeat protein